MRRKCLNKNLTGLGIERKEGLSSGCLPPVLKDRLGVIGSFLEEERSKVREGMLLRLSMQESGFRLWKNRGEWGPGWGHICGTRTAGQGHGKLLINSLKTNSKEILPSTCPLLFFLTLTRMASPSLPLSL